MVSKYSDIEDLRALGELTPAEEALIVGCRNGTVCILGDGKRPDDPESQADPQRIIRAALLRYLILGGCDQFRVHDFGLRLVGAHVTGALDISFGKAKGRTYLTNCRFSEKITALQTRFDLINLSGSAVPGIFAQGIRVAGAAFLHEDFYTDGEVCLAGAVIGGQLNCASGQIENFGGVALNLEGARVTGDVFLSDGFSAVGEVSLSGAQIGGQLSCNGGKFTNPKGFALIAEDAQVNGAVLLNTGFSAHGEVGLSGAKIKGQFSCKNGSFNNPDGHALSAQSLSVHEGLLWKEVTVPHGNVSFASAHAGDLVDDLDSWPAPGPDGLPRLILNGFTYDAIAGIAPTDAKTRLKWLGRGTVWGTEFRPQPYTQLAKVLRGMGHDRDAKTVLMERERLTACYARNRRIAAQLEQVNGVTPFDYARRIWWLVSDFLFRICAGYGHAPFRAIWSLIALIALASTLAQMAYTQGRMVPNSDVILASPDWRRVAGSDTPAQDWIATTPAGRDWESFNAVAYGFDVVVPLISLGQDAAWAPSPARARPARVLWWVRWLLIGAGWGISAIAVAAFTGLIKQDRD